MEGLVPGTYVVVGSVQGGVLHFCSRRGTDWLIIGDPREERVGEGLGRQASANENTCGQNLVKFAGVRQICAGFWFLWW